MNSIDEKVFTICTDLVYIVEEKFYMRDIVFNSQNCNYIFYSIYKIFKKNNKEHLFKEKLYKYIEYIITKTDSSISYDYNILYDNLSFFKNEKIMKNKEIEYLKNIINNYIKINKLEENKIYVYSNIS